MFIIVNRPQLDNMIIYFKGRVSKYRKSTKLNKITLIFYNCIQMLCYSKVDSSVIFLISFFNQFGIFCKLINIDFYHFLKKLRI